MASSIYTGILNKVKARNKAIKVAGGGDSGKRLKANPNPGTKISTKSATEPKVKKN